MILDRVDKFNDTIWYNTVQYGTVQYGTIVTWFTCGFSHLTMRFVLAAGPSRTVRYDTVAYSTVRYGMVPYRISFINNGHIDEYVGLST